MRKLFFSPFDFDKEKKFTFFLCDFYKEELFLNLSNKRFLLAVKKPSYCFYVISMYQTWLLQTINQLPEIIKNVKFLLVNTRNRKYSVSQDSLHYNGRFPVLFKPNA